MTPGPAATLVAAGNKALDISERRSRAVKVVNGA
jgi:hypothetical protein